MHKIYEFICSHNKLKNFLKKFSFLFKVVPLRFVLANYREYFLKKNTNKNSECVEASILSEEAYAIYNILKKK